MVSFHTATENGGQGWAYIWGKVHIPQSRSCLLLKRGEGGLISGGYGTGKYEGTSALKHVQVKD